MADNTQSHFPEDEIWYDIPSFKGLYQFSNTYKCRSLDRRVMARYGLRTINGSAKKINYSGEYPSLSLWDGNKEKRVLVHLIVGCLFVSNPESKPQINHKNGNKHDFRKENLEWVTPSENRQHAFDTGLQKPYTRFGEDNPNAKLTHIHAKTIRDCFATGKYTKSGLAKIFSIDNSVISDIVNHK